MNILEYNEYLGPHLAHHGVRGMEHGKRRWQNYDGSLTPEGRVHYGYGEVKNKKAKKFEKYSDKQHKKIDKRYDKADDKLAYKVAKRTLRYRNNPTEANAMRLYKAVKKRYNTQDLRDLEHERIDNLSVHNYKADKVSKISPPVISDIVSAKKIGFTAGSAKDATKFLRRVSLDDYSRIDNRNISRAEEFVTNVENMTEFTNPISKGVKRALR